MWKFGKNLEIWKKFGNFKKNWKFEKKLEMWKKIRNLERIWKFGKNLEIWKKELEKLNNESEIDDWINKRKLLL